MRRQVELLVSDTSHVLDFETSARRTPIGSGRTPATALARLDVPPEKSIDSGPWRVASATCRHKVRPRDFGSEPQGGWL